MYFEKRELVTSINSNNNKIRNYYDTFGFVVIRNFIDKSERKILKRNYDAEFKKKLKEASLITMFINRLGLSGERIFGFRDILNQIRRLPGILFLPNFIDNNKFFTNLFFSNFYLKAYDYFAGKDWVYMGSDGQQYIKGGGFSWHRDWFLMAPQIKIFFLIDPKIALGQKFLIIPGGSNPNDIYSRNLSKASNWPMPNDNPGGLSDQGFLPEIQNPRYVFRTSKKSDIPHVALKLKFGDALFFDQRNFHCLSGNFPKFDVKMMSLLISKNPFHFSKSDPVLKGTTRTKMTKGFIDLIVSERNHCKTEEGYGSELTKSEVYKKFPNHFIKFLKNSKNNIFTSGEITYCGNKKFKSKIDKSYYRKIGISHKNKFYKSLGNKTTDKLTTDYGFDDVHLGVVSQIKSN
jgi:hypothetical protein